MNGNSNGKKKRRKRIIIFGVVAAVLLVFAGALFAFTRGGTKIDPTKLAKVASRAGPSTAKPASGLGRSSTKTGSLAWAAASRQKHIVAANEMMIERRAGMHPDRRQKQERHCPVQRESLSRQHAVRCDKHR